MDDIKKALPERIDLDPAIQDLLLSFGEMIQWSERCGVSGYSETWKISTVQVCDPGPSSQYFLKIVTASRAEEYIRGEYTGMMALQKTMPTLVPKSHGWGKAKNRDSTYWYLRDFVPLDPDRMPNAAQLGKLVAELHTRGQAPGACFGFAVPVFDYVYEMEHAWDSDWTSFFGKLLARGYAHYLTNSAAAGRGGHTELEDGMAVVLRDVVPAMLRPLGNVTPCLIHGDLWEGNIATDPESGSIKLFDPCTVYAHHEMGVSSWRSMHHKIHAPEYRAEYFRNYPPDEPVDQADDRNRLYSLYQQLVYYGQHGTPELGRQCVGDIEYLVKRYGRKEGDEEK